MAFTRFHDDYARVNKQLQESTDPGRWIINTPGCGVDGHKYISDPFCRLQHWGANIMTNTTDVEGDLMGLTRKSNRDDIGDNSHYLNSVKTSKVNYQTNDFQTQQSLATNPGWLYKDLEQNNFNYLHFDPQENIFINFENNVNTTLLEKDNFEHNNCK